MAKVIRQQHKNGSKLRILLFVLLSFGLISPALAQTTTYNTQGVTNANHGDGVNPIAIEHDSDIFPWTDSADQNDSAFPSDAEYVNISADNTAQWATDDPNSNDEMAITFRFFIQEAIGTISNIEITWNGNTDGGTSNHSIWLRKDGFDEFGGTSTWVQLGSSLAIPADTDTDLIRNLTSDFSTYINASTGQFESVVTTSRSSDDMRTNYVQVVVTYTDVAVDSIGSQTSPLSIPSTDQYVGGAFVITEDTSRNVTGITITEKGTVDAALNLDNIELWYDLDTTSPYDCASVSYGGDELQFGATDTDGFSAANGTSAFTGTVAISTTQSMCVYVVLDVGSGATDGETLEIEISDPSTEVTVDGGGTVGPGSAVALSGTTTFVKSMVIFLR